MKETRCSYLYRRKLALARDAHRPVRCLPKTIKKWILEVETPAVRVRVGDEN